MNETQPTKRRPKAKKLARFTLASNRILYHPDLSANDKIVYMALLDHGEKSWPAYQTLADALNIGRSTVIRSVIKLEGLGIVTKESRGHHRSNLYITKGAKELLEEAQIDTQTSSNLTPQGCQADTLTSSNLTLRSRTTEKKPGKRTKEADDALGSVVDVDRHSASARDGQTGVVYMGAENPAPIPDGITPTTSITPKDLHTEKEGARSAIPLGEIKWLEELWGPLDQSQLPTFERAYSVNPDGTQRVINNVGDRHERGEIANPWGYALTILSSDDHLKPRPAIEPAQPARPAQDSITWPTESKGD